MNKLLEMIYDNYFNLDCNLGFSTDKEYIRFVFELRNIDKDKFNLKEYINNYNCNIRNVLLKKIESGENDKFFTEKEFLHFIYPYEQTLQRFQILYITIGDEEWNNTFGFSYKVFIDFVCYILFRSFLYNDYKVAKKKRKREYKKLFPQSTNYFFTKEELYNQFPQKNESIDRILELLSIEINAIKDIKDVYLILKYNNKYILYFIWDFIYNSYDFFENKIVEYHKTKKEEEKFYKKRGVEFERYCYHKLVEGFPKSNIYRKLYYDDKKGC